MTANISKEYGSLPRSRSTAALLGNIALISALALFAAGWLVLIVVGVLSDLVGVPLPVIEAVGLLIYFSSALPIIPSALAGIGVIFRLVGWMTDRFTRVPICRRS